MHFLLPPRQIAGQWRAKWRGGDAGRARPRCRMNDAKNGRRREAAARPRITEVLYRVNNCGTARQFAVSFFAP